MIAPGPPGRGRCNGCVPFYADPPADLSADRPGGWWCFVCGGVLPKTPCCLRRRRAYRAPLDQGAFQLGLRCGSPRMFNIVQDAVDGPAPHLVVRQGHGGEAGPEGIRNELKVVD